MKKNTLWVFLLAGGLAQAQIPVRSLGKLDDAESPDKPEIKAKVKQSVKAWQLTNDYTYADTLSVDTLVQGYQVFNPIFKRSISNVHLGNLGAPSMAMDFSQREMRHDFIFYNSLLPYFEAPQDYVYYNTRTPYVNLTYHMGQPKRRSEEMIRALFTQNINKHWNVGIQYQLFSSIGRYEAQKVDNQNFRLFSSYNGKRYSAHGFFSYARSQQFENGGITNEDYILNAPDYDYGQPENVPVSFLDAHSRLSNYQFFYHHGYTLGSVNYVDAKGESQHASIATVYHTLHVDQAKRRYRIDDLPDYSNASLNHFYPNVYIDSLTTNDSLRYRLIHNQFQIQFNEEANPWLRFGLRAFIGNEIRTYQMPAAPGYDQELNVVYRQQKEQQVTSYLGGRIFKNRGESFRWNAGLKFFFQGYRVGDLEVDGRLDTYFDMGRSKANLFASGSFRLRSAGYWEENYFSNHLQWNLNLNREKRIDVKGGFRIPDHKAQLTGFLTTYTDYVYYSTSGLPQQQSGVIQVIGAKGEKHFQWLKLHCIPSLVWQFISNKTVMPLPDLSLFATSYYENQLFKVLTFQIGFDVRYHTQYYSPYYLPAIGQFVTQDFRKTGNYPFADLFLNLHLKRARAYVKYEHVNKGWPNNDYFHTIFYPANPRSIKFGVSWNFYD